MYPIWPLPHHRPWLTLGEEIDRDVDAFFSYAALCYYYRDPNEGRLGRW
jgi:hypothetical protein